MNPRIFRYLEPTFCAGLIEDPCFIIRDRPIHRSIMVDCGSLAHVAKRELKPVRAIFISHAHMDHFMGFDAFVRQVHASPRTVDIFGPPGFRDRVAARLAGYDWNLAEPYWCTFVVHEVHADRMVTFEFSGPSGFACRWLGEERRADAVIYRHNHLEVAAELLDHAIPVLAFRVTERKLFSVDEGKMSAQGFVAGGWLRALKKQFYDDWTGGPPLVALRRIAGDLHEEEWVDPSLLYGCIREERPVAAIGYLTDIGFTSDNLERATRLLSGVTLLVAECAFLSGERHKARASHHLCTGDVNRLLDAVRPRWFLPFHLSKTYQGRSAELYAELTPPEGTTILRLSEHVAARPLFACEMPDPVPVVS